MTRFLTACAVFLIYTTVFAQQNNPLVAKDARAQKQWVDSVYNTMNLDQKNWSVVYASSILKSRSCT
jgi:hypothetical protein